MLRRISLICCLLLGLIACGAEISSNSPQAIAENRPVDLTIIPQNTSIPIIPTNTLGVEPTVIQPTAAELSPTAIVASPTVELAQRDPIQLQLKLEPNQTIRYQNTLIHDLIQPTGATSQTATISMTHNLRYEVLTVNDQEITCRLVLERLHLTQSLGAMRIEFDTASPKQDAFTAKYALFSAIIEQPITLTLKPTGVIAKVEGMDNLIDLMVRASSGDRELQTTVYNNALQLYLLTPNFMAYREQPVAVYDTWHVITPIAAEMTTFVVTSTHQLTSYTPDQAMISVNGTIGDIRLSVAEEAQSRGMGMILRADLEQSSTQTGSIVVDRQTGLIATSMLDHMVFSSMILPNTPDDFGGFAQIDRIRIYTQLQP